MDFLIRAILFILSSSSQCCVSELVGRRVESFLIVIGAKVVRLTFVDRLWIGLRIDIHSTDGAEWMFGGGDGRGGINLIGIRVHPALPLIFHVVGSFLGDFAAVVALDHAKREIDARRKSARAGEIAILDEPSSALEIDVWE